MELKERKERAIEALRKLDNTEALGYVEDVLDIVEAKEPIVAYTVKGQPLTKEDYINRIKSADKAMDEGKYISHEELKKERKSW